MPPFVREAAVVAGGASAEPFALEADRMLSSVPSNDQRYLPGKGMRPRTEPLPAAQFDWIVGSVLLITPFIAIWGIINVPLQTPTLIYTVLLYFASGLGITAGYHRLWSHKAYDAAWPLELFLALSGAAAMEGSGRWWCRNHRAHHKFTDTPKDPYNVRRSLLWAHIGWMLVKQNKNEVGYADITDLDENKILQWQHRNYPLLVLLCGVAVPWLTAGLLWGDWWGGYFYCVILRLVFIHHSTFFVNSLAHYLGNQPYSDMHTAFDSFITAVLSLGEGYHNYHHEFPQDYRNGIKWYHYDPTKWFIVACSYVGLAYNLKFIPKNEIDKAKLQMSQVGLH
ncbi:stearoyl-CoA desaturase, variant [Capsaspora owczarzaki ATCC 30864]|uniref:Stearoyl-CoA desaturase, variant n=1 Tax=Capsaspora owczarzaki (strain ATCC 30864) TaxID=595528 RepID=A0A0D2WW44_CAPO3|nr:stearoyl-CoA desaturase, variant [Capsaspora owczarzaki ATCC 30864]